MVEHQPGRLGAIAVAPGILLADRDVVQGRTVVAVELGQRAGPDEPIRLANMHRQRKRLRTKRPGREEPLDLLGPHRAVLVAGQAGHFGV